MQTINDTLRHLHLGAATVFEGMTVFPLFSDQLRDRDYLTLDEALEQGQARVSEVSEEGEVPNLLFENLGSRKVLLVDGDELVGAKQNRIVNLSILVGAHTKIEIPVSCVEAGRWSYQDREFSSTKRAMYSRARASKAEAVTVRMRRSGERYSDQSEVWNNIAECSADLDVDSLTSSMSDIYKRHEQRLAVTGGIRARRPGRALLPSMEQRRTEIFDSVDLAHYLIAWSPATRLVRRAWASQGMRF
jgi:hypothetical protein